MEWKEKNKTLVRTGECNRCGQCCIDEKCVHLKFENNLAICTIYNDRDKLCDICNEKLVKLGKEKKYTHKVCIDFPNHPYLNCLKTRKCGYKWQ